MCYANRSQAKLLALLLCGLLLAACGGGESRKQQHMEAGNQFLAERNYTKARVEFRNALQIDPKDATALALVGVSAEKLGDIDEALKFYRGALAIDPDQLIALANMGRLYAASGLPEEAMKIIDPGLAKHPASAELLSVRAMIKSQQEDRAGALQDATEAVRLSPGYVEAVGLLAALTWQEGRRDEATAQMRKAVEAHPREPELRQQLAQFLQLSGDSQGQAVQLAALVEIEPGRIEHRYRLAQMYLQQNRVDEALNVLRKAVDSRPDDTTPKLALADVLVTSRSFEEAERQMLAYVKAAPDNLDLQVAVGRFYESQNRLDSAETVYRGIVKQAGEKSQGVVARTRIASIFIRSGRSKEAVPLIEEVLKGNPTNADALVMRAQLAMQSGDNAAAIGDLRAALRDQPDSHLLSVQLAQAYIRSGDMALAEQTLRSAVQASPDEAEPRLALAQFFVNQRRLQQAKPLLEQLVNEQPGNTEAIEALARVHLMTGDPDAALAGAQALQTIQPKQSVGYSLAGSAFEALKRTDDARKSYEQATALEPGAFEPLAALLRLDLAENQPQRALARIDERIAARPDNAALHGMRGDLLMAQRRPAEALASYTQAAKLAPALPQPYRGQASAYAALGQRDQATAALKAGVEATNYARDLVADLGVNYSSSGRVDEAIALYEGAIARDPTNLIAGNNLAMLLVNQRPDAKNLERAGILTAPFADSNRPSLLDSYGWVLHKRGKHAEALTALTRVVELAPNVPEFRYHLGAVQKALGQTADARQNLEAAVAGADFPEHQDAKAALADL